MNSKNLPQHSSDTGLYHFLKKIRDYLEDLEEKSPMGSEEMRWLDGYLQRADRELVLRALDTGGRTADGEIVYQRDYHFKGEYLEIFDMLTEFLILRPDFIHTFSAAVDAALNATTPPMTVKKIQDEPDNRNAPL